LRNVALPIRRIDKGLLALTTTTSERMGGLEFYQLPPHGFARSIPGLLFHKSSINCKTEDQLPQFGNCGMGVGELLELGHKG